MKTIDGKMFRAMVETGANLLHNNHPEIDALNVFPVPDGDTGTNMSLTFNNGIAEVKKSGSEQLSVVAKTLSRGLLMGARGNSGVILSQIFRGFQQYVGDKEELTVKEFAEAMLNGAKLAYKAVMRPVEGTILTVVRESTDYADVYAEQNPELTINEYLEVLCKEAQASLDRTPELLPILKEARVVDSGGAGLLAIFTGFRAYIEGSPIEEASKSNASKDSFVKESGYCVEFILRLSDSGVHLYKEDRFRSSLNKLGQNMTVILDESLLKVRVYSITPGEVLNLGQRYGEFVKVQIDNVEEGLKPSILEEEEEPAEEKEFGIITVGSGEGLKKLFLDYRADVVVTGGQTMNPSTEDFVSAIKKVNARHIFILPNNSNIIMAAQQAASVSEGKDIIVLPTKSVPQGLAACISFNPEGTVEENSADMKAAIEHVKTGSITYAIKDTTVDGREIHAGDYMGILEKDIVVTSKEKIEAACELIKQMCDEDSEIVTLIRGEDATDEEFEAIQKFIEENYEVDIDAEDGKQPVYSFIIGVE